MDKDKIALIVVCLMVDLKDAVRTLEGNVPECYHQSIQEAEELLNILEYGGK